MASFKTLPDFKVSFVVGDDTISEFSINELRSNQPAVIDFWTTKCTRCPSALEKLNNLSLKWGKSGIKFYSCVLGDKETASELLNGMWESMTHIHMEFEIKEEVKSFFGFTQVPFVVIVNKHGAVVVADSPQKINFPEILSLIDSDQPHTDILENNGDLSNTNSTAQPESELTNQKQIQTSGAAALSLPAFVLDEDF